MPSPPKDVRFIHGGGGFLKLAGQKKQLPKREGFPQPNTVGSNSIESEESEDEDLIISESLQDPSALPREADSEEFTVFEYHVVRPSRENVPFVFVASERFWNQSLFVPAAELGADCPVTASVTGFQLDVRGPGLAAARMHRGGRPPVSGSCLGSVCVRQVSLCPCQYASVLRVAGSVLSVLLRAFRSRAG